MLMCVKEAKRQLGRKKCPVGKKYVSSWKNLFSPVGNMKLRGYWAFRPILYFFTHQAA